MVFILRKKWLVIVLSVISSANLQFQYPVPGPMFAFPPPPPPPVPFAVPVAIPVVFSSNSGNRNPQATTTTTTSTTEDPYKNIPAQMPLPVQISIFPQNNKPHFIPMPFPAPFPQPFHMPMPIPPPPPPLVVLPLPRHKNKGYSQSESNESRDTSCSSDKNTRRKRRRKKIGHSLKRPRYSRMMAHERKGRKLKDNELVKPILTYVARNGDVKLKKSLSNDEAAALINEQPYQNVKIFSDNNLNDGNNIKVVSVNDDNPESKHKKRRVILRSGSSQHSLGAGKKELVFNPPMDSKISNLSVSFQISRD